MKNKIKYSLLTKENVKKLQSFISLYYKKNHILSKNTNLLNWFYKKNVSYNFFLAKKNNEIIGAQGFIPHKKFDKNLTKDAFLAFWCVKKSKNIGVGINLFKKIINKFEFIGVAQINKRLLGYHKWLGFNVNKMSHFFYPNRYKKLKFLKNNYKKIIFKKKNFNIYNVDKKNILKLKVNKSTFENYLPTKSKSYLKKKYLENPFYNYKIYFLKQNKIEVFIVIRKIKIKDTIIIRIVDFVGNVQNIKFLGNFFKDLLIRSEAEYLDLYNYGIDEKDLKSCGFINRYKSKEVVPNHFEPFENLNKDIYCAFKTKISKKVCLFKGDGDLERPSKI